MTQVGTPTVLSRPRASVQSPVAGGPGPVPRDAIAALAYNKWKKRNCPVGDDLRDWYEAEKELAAKQKDQCRTS